MKSFFRTFFAALLAFITFAVLLLIVTVAIVSSVGAEKEEEAGEKAVLVLDLSDHFPEVESVDPVSFLTRSGTGGIPSLARLLRLLAHAATDPSVKGIYLKAESNSNGLASSEEIRHALQAFRSSGKFIYAYGTSLSQKSYYIASVASKIYCNPVGGLQWRGLGLQMPFIKGTLEKLEVEPQIFYAGKFKSATEPFREKQMTSYNRLQSMQVISDINRHLLTQISASRNIDTAALQLFADSNKLQFAADALKYKMIDGLKYDDEVKDEMKKKLGVAKDEKINFLSLSKYAATIPADEPEKNRIAVIYAEGNIIDGKGDREVIGSETYKSHIRKAREDESVKAVVLRINTGGGSTTASEEIWREITVTRKVKPVMVSFGDMSASGGYYVACNADSIFAEPGTITGSIGVFGIMMNMEKFFNNKLGITFDGVGTSRNANIPTPFKPLSEEQKRYFQNAVDTSYHTFLLRVAEGRNKPLSYIDSIAQGRIWSGQRAVELGLVDRIGGLKDAIAAAASKAKISQYSIKELPAKQNWMEMIFGDKEAVRNEAIKEELGQNAYTIYYMLKDLGESAGKVQARMPFEIIIE